MIDENFLGKLIERLENSIYEIQVCNQKYLKEMLKEKDLFDKFPMISFEKNSDNSFQVDPDESKFLNDSTHSGIWIYALDWGEDVTFIMNLKDVADTLFIDAFEISTDRRGCGLGKILVSDVEVSVKDYFRFVVATPFDTDALEFWRHMGYHSSDRGDMVRDITV